MSDRFQVETADLPFEYMLNVLRLTDDFGEDDFEARTGVAFARIAPAVAEAQRKRLLQQAGAGRWRVTELGQRFLNDLQAVVPARAGGGRAVAGQRRLRSESSMSNGALPRASS